MYAPQYQCQGGPVAEAVYLVKAYATVEGDGMLLFEVQLPQGLDPVAVRCCCLPLLLFGHTPSQPWRPQADPSAGPGPHQPTAVRPLPDL